jgi:hypothetical protein
MAGLPATGKSSIAREVAARIAAQAMLCVAAALAALEAEVANLDTLAAPV